jgi:outer membrane protein assembly factor BamB
VYKWELGNSSIIDTLNISPLPNKEINKQYPFIKTTWVYEDNASIMGGMALSSDSLLVWATSDGVLKVVGKHSKNIKWEKKLGKSIFSTPVVNKDKVIIGTLQGTIKAFNILNGEELWSTNVNHPVFSEGVIEGDYIYISCGKGGVYKLSTLNGTIVWNFANVNGFLQSKVCLTEKEVIFGAWDKYLYCVNKINGSLNWKWTNGHNAILYSPGNVVPAVANNKVFLVAPDRYLTILDQKTGRELYRSNEHKVRESMGITADKKFIVAKLMNDSLLVVSTQQSKPVAQTIDCGFGYEHNPCPLVEKNGIVYAGTKNGVLFAVDINRQKLLWKHKIGNSAVNKILIDNKDTVWIVLMEGIIASLS